MTIEIRWVIFFVVLAFSQGFFIGSHFAFKKLMKEMDEFRKAAGK